MPPQNKGASTARRRLRFQAGKRKPNRAGSPRPAPRPRDSGLAACSPMETLAGLLDRDASFEDAWGMFEVGTHGRHWPGSCELLAQTRETCWVSDVPPARADPAVPPSSGAWDGQGWVRSLPQSCVIWGSCAHSLCPSLCVPRGTFDSDCLCPLPRGKLYPITRALWDAVLQHPCTWEGCTLSPKQGKILVHHPGTRGGQGHLMS